MYSVQASHWDGKVARASHILGGAALGRVIYSTGYRQNSIIFRDEGKIIAGTIDKIIKHSHPHPFTQEVIATTYVEAIAMEPINREDDLYRSLNCGWLCLQTPTRRRISTVPLSNVISHFVRTDLTLLVKENPVTHVYPVPKELELNMDRSKTDFHDATALVHRLRTEILTSLGCDTVDDQCLKVITTNEAEYFWSFVDGVLSTSDVASSSASPSDPPEADISASELTVLLIEQCLKLDELAGNLHTGVAERHLRNQCKQLCYLARSL
ncbi:hypothetical protein F5051DRAFT_445787 [Lentinula edodes]|nr:hypothetical protein F5051DRAFT_445787 [Lentinula edodes]